MLTFDLIKIFLPLHQRKYCRVIQSIHHSILYIEHKKGHFTACNKLRNKHKYGVRELEAR